MRSFFHLVAVLPLLAGVPAIAQADALSFEHALDLALRQSPELEAGSASVRAAQWERAAAGRLPDPKLTAGVDNFPVSGPMRGSLEGDFMTMRKLGLMQDFPASGKRRAQVEAAAAGVGVSEAEQRVRQWKVRLAAAQAWLGRYYQERRVEAFEQVTRASESLLAALPSQLAAGRSVAADSVEQRQELLRLADRRDELDRDVAQAAATLRSILGPQADGPLAATAPDFAIDAGSIRSRLDAHPELEVYDAQQRQAQAEVEAAKAEKRPDWGVELTYARRNPQFGDMVSVQFSLTLPFFGARRQDPAIASKLETRGRIEAERDVWRRDRIREFESDLAERDALARQLDRARGDALPLAEERVDLQTAAFGAGRAPLSAVLSARRDVAEARLRIVELEGRLAAVGAKLHFTFDARQP